MKVPKSLGKAGKKFWRTVLEEFSLSDAHDLERLTLACTCLDAIDAAERQIAEDGPFIRDRYGQTKEHPAGKVVRENKIIFVRIVREMALDIGGAGIKTTEEVLTCLEDQEKRGFTGEALKILSDTS